MRLVLDLPGEGVWRYPEVGPVLPLNRSRRTRRRSRASSRSSARPTCAPGRWEPEPKFPSPDLVGYLRKGSQCPKDFSLSLAMSPVRIRSLMECPGHTHGHHTVEGNVAVAVVI